MLCIFVFNMTKGVFTVAKSIYDRIRNVKSSLENAEQSFRENNGVRGELDLMLAEAEIKHLREKRGWISVWNRQRLALFIAVVVILAGYGGWMYAEKNMVEEANPQLNQVVENKMLEEVVTPTGETEKIASEKKETKEENTVVVPQQQKVVREERNVDLPVADMRQLVRDARRTLRDAN